MASGDILFKTLRNADGKAFSKYKGLQNSFVLDDMELFFDDVQNDRSGHTAMRVRVPMGRAGFPEDTFSNPSREVALRDLVCRRFWESARVHARSPIPKTDGGQIYIPRPGQEILERGSVTVTRFHIETRFTADLPSKAGKASADAMMELIERIRTVVSESMLFSAYKPSKLYNHLHTNENADFIRDSLHSKGLAAFVSDGAVLPRRDDGLAPKADAVPFSCSEDLAVRFEVPNGDPLTGMGIPEGFTVLTGPSRNGKSSLLNAVFAGICNHIPGDGREYVVTAPDAHFTAGEGGRPADSVDISMFVAETPEFDDTSRALSPVVSSPMSELVGISEAVEMGSTLIIADEEHSAPCIIRRGFLAIDDEITSLSEIGGAMAGKGVSLLMASGDRQASEAADLVILVDGFGASVADVEGNVAESAYERPATRYPVSKGMSFEKGRKDVSASVLAMRSVEIGELRVDAPMSGIFDTAQTQAVADAVVIARDLMDGSRSMREVCTEALRILHEADAETGGGMRHARVRAMDLAAFLNRHPQMLAIQKGKVSGGCCRSCSASC